MYGEKRERELRIKITFKLWVRFIRMDILEGLGFIPEILHLQRNHELGLEHENGVLCSLMRYDQ